MNLDSCKIDNEEVKKLKITCFQNLALVLNKTNDHEDAVRQCTLALEVDPEAVKALYTRGQAHTKLMNFAEATADLKAAIKLQPGNK
jgi:tetratricopeptide (TPR) repeat protein